MTNEPEIGIEPFNCFEFNGQTYVAKGEALKYLPDSARRSVVNDESEFYGLQGAKGNYVLTPVKDPFLTSKIEERHRRLVAHKNHDDFMNSTNLGAPLLPLSSYTGNF